MSSRPQPDRPRLVPHARYRWDKRRGQHQLLFPEGVLVLNDTAAAIVQLCDGRPLDELIAALRDRSRSASIEADVREFLARLASKNLLCDSPTG